MHTDIVPDGRRGQTQLRACSPSRKHDSHKNIIERADSAYLTLKTDKDLSSLAALIETNCDATKGELRDIIKNDDRWRQWLARPGQREASHALEYLLKAYFFMNSAFWDDQQTLKNFCDETFTPIKPAPSPDDWQLRDYELTLTAHSLEKIADFRVVWTSRLDQHLRFDNRAKIVKVFQRPAALQPGGFLHACCIYPDGFLQETLETLSLLFRWTDQANIRYNRARGAEMAVDVERAELPLVKTRLSNYKFWSARLVRLQEELDKSSPRTLCQWWYDWRDPNRTWTFWLAITAIGLALCFGLIQSITGLIQVVYAARQGGGGG